jgi:hypothetical protein
VSRASPRIGRFGRGARALCVALGALAAGCGYSTGMRVEEAAGRTVGIAFFDNQTYERDLERDLHDEMTRVVLQVVDAPLVAPDHSDLVVRGTLVRYQRRGGIRSPNNQLLETGIRVDARASLWRRRRPSDPAPVQRTDRQKRGKERLGYDHRRGLTYERDFSSQPVLASFDEDAWIEVTSARAVVQVGYIIGEAGNEGVARDRALRNVSERLVLDLFADMN